MELDFSSTRSLKKEFEVLMDCLYRKRRRMYGTSWRSENVDGGGQIAEGALKTPDAVNTKLAARGVEEVRDVLKR